VNVLVAVAVAEAAAVNVLVAMIVPPRRLFCFDFILEKDQRSKQ